MKITFVTDYVCPYCFAAKETLKIALEEENIQAEITVQPFELTEDGKKQVDTYHDETRKAHYQVLVEPCSEIGLDMKLPPNVVPRPYTRLAFEGRLFAREHGKEEEWNDAMYRAYFTFEKDIGNADVLMQECEKLGMDSTELRKDFDMGTYAEEERQLNRYSHEIMQIHSVPTIFIDGNRIALNDYSLAEMKAALRENQSSEGGFSCGEDGYCGFN